MLPDTSGANSARKRTQRVQLACDPCRLGKLKCDRNLPICDQCYKRSRESTCKYTERGLRYNTARQKTDSMREKIDRLENFVNRMKDDRTQGTDQAYTTAGGDHQNGGAEGELVPLAGKLNLSERGTRYVGGAHWESIIDDIADVKAYFDQESSGPSFDELVEEGTVVPDLDSSPSDIVLGVSQCYSKQDLLQLMPQKTEMDRLVATWFNVADPVRLIVHAVMFQKQYQSFWTNPEEVTPGWLALLCAVGSAGAQVSGQARRDGPTLSLAEDLRKLTTHALVLANSVHPQPYTIEALIFHEKSLLLKNHDTLPLVWQIHGQVMRLCYHAGYHRDPGSNPNISVFDCEMRRRVWLVALEYDVMCSYQLGLASLLNRKLYDTKPPLNLLDSDFVDDNIPPARSHDDYTLILAGLNHGSLVGIFGDIIITSHTITAPSKADLTLLRERLDEVHNSLPSTLQILPMDQCFMDTPAQILDRYRLELVYHKALCVLYRRFLGQSGYEQEHQYCLDAAEALIFHQVPLLEAAQAGGVMAPCLVFIYRHVHDFNLAAMLLCSEIKRLSINDFEEDDKGRTSRVRPMLLQLCALWNYSGVVSPKARHAVRAIEKFIIQTPFAQPESGMSSTNPAHGIPGLKAGMTDIIPPGQVNNASFYNPIDVESGSSPSDNSMPEDFGIDQDPLFQDLFGSMISGQGQVTQLRWP